jgi:hypothetical protein
MGLLTNKGLVRMKKGDVEHDFVLESVPVWEARGWKVVESSNKKAGPSDEAKRLAELNEAAKKELAEKEAARTAQQTTSQGK